ncbi:MAG: ABC transporter substrate-binding protein, partial [Planctomycetes bacterium]|nr:ABC transporter substrate-binding protein [Planctomycetota bacterium]
MAGCGNEYMANPATLQLQQAGEEAAQKYDGKVYKWRLALFVPSKFEIWGPGVQRFADTARVLSQGALDIRVKGAGEIVPSMQIFDAVKDGDVEMGHSASYFWDGKDPNLRAAVYFTSVPFGMTARGAASWLSAAGGQELWDELYAPFNLKALSLGNTGVQAGGWFRKPIKTLEDLQGIKMRMPGLGGKVLTRAGGIAQTLPGHEIYIALERGRIDATEWIGPYHDYQRGFHEVAPYYYTGGWHEPGSILELLINKEKWDALPSHLQRIIEVASVEA